MIPARLSTALDRASTIVVIGAVIVLIWTRLSLPEPQDLRRVDGVRVDASRLTNAEGESNVVLVTFTDFQCPYCERYERDTYPLIQRELVAQGLLRYGVMQFPIREIHPQAVKASEAAECAAKQGKYREMHDYLFQDLGRNSLSPTHLLAAAAVIGLDYGSFEQCLDGEASDKVAADLAEGQRLGVSGTPAFLVGITEPGGSIVFHRRIVGSVSFETLRDEVELVRRMAEPGPVSRVLEPITSFFRSL